MNTPLDERKEKVLKVMKELGIFEPYRDGFKKRNKVCFFEGFGGF